MEGVKGFAEILEHLVYELFGLLLPGAAMALLVARVWSTTSWQQALTFADNQPWLAFGAAYLVGYVVQGISRPTTTLLEALLRLPGRLLGSLIGLIAPKFRTRLRAWRGAAGDFLQRRHRHTHTRLPVEQAVDLKLIARGEWERRLQLPEGRVLSESQVRDLSFSALLGNLGRLDRFRAAASLARGTAAAVAITFVIIATQLLFGLRTLSGGMFAALATLLVSFYALLSRSDFYDRLWNDVLHPQFLATIAHERAATRDVANRPPST
jgi:hypothetical protein